MTSRVTMCITAYRLAGTAEDHATPSRAHARPCTHVSTAVIITTVASKTSTARVFRDGEGPLRTCIRIPPVRPNASNATFEQLRTPQTPAIALAYSNLAIMLQQQRTFLPTHPNRPRFEAPTRRQYLQAPPSSTQGIFAPLHARSLARPPQPTCAPRTGSRRTPARRRRRSAASPAASSS